MKFTPRLTAPAAGDKNWINKGYGGNNRAIVINRNTGSVLANCVGYVNGRANELMGGVDAGLCVNNADAFYGYLGDGYPRSDKPTLGAIICWRCAGKKGHVAVVEEIYEDGTVLASQSNYAGTLFYTKRIDPKKWPVGYTFQGYICPDYHFEQIDPISPDPVRLRMGYASEGDIKTICARIDAMSVPYTVDAGYIVTDVPVSSGDQIALLTLCGSLAVPCAEYIPQDDKDARIHELEQQLAASVAENTRLKEEEEQLEQQLDATTLALNDANATVTKQRKQIDGAVEVLTA